jgi:ElaB/YqjD/DUF883 family membrane-anchored ribosome-binding protein
MDRGEPSLSAPDFTTEPTITAEVAYLRPEYANAQQDFSVGAASETLADEPVRRNIEAMNTPTREEFDLHLRHLDDRLDSHFKLLDERIKSQNDLYMQWRDSQQKLLDERDQRLATAIDDIKKDSASARTETAEQARSLKTILVTTAIGTVIAIVGGIAAFNATVLSNMMSSFESGKNTATSIVQATDQLKQVQDDLSKTQQQLQMVLDRSKPAPAPASSPASPQ